MRIGVFGGSFDPIHVGHLIVAEQCRVQATLDQVWWVPSATAPHKPGGATAGGKQRIEMVQLAVAGHEAFYVSDVELERGQVSYTVETLRQLQQAHPGHDWYLILGGDSLAQWHSWREPTEICRLARPLVYARPGQSLDWDALERLIGREEMDSIRDRLVEGPLIDISSTQLREWVGTGRSIRYLVPRAIETYIHTHGLYRPG